MEGESSKVADDAATELSIWEKMVLEERKLEAEKRGIRLCDLEEETSLFRALEESVPEKQNATDGKSSSTSSASSSSSNRPMSTMPSSIARESKRMTTASQIAATVSDEDEEYHNNDDEENSDDEKQRAQLLPALPGPYAANVRTISSSMAVSDIPVTEVLQELCIWQLFLPQDLTNRILMFLGDVDMCGYLHQIARTNCFKPNESVYKTLCESVYLTQSKKKKLVVENWKSWRNMLVFRPRIRTNGFYCLRTLYTRAPSNDSFWEEKITQSVEVKFYRHMRFFDDGRMLYSLDTVEPEDMAKHLNLGVVVPKKIFEGTYTLVGKNVHVEVIMHYAVVHFSLVILDGQDGYVGKHNTLRMVEHASAAVFRGMPGGVYWGTEKVSHKLPNNTDLQFWRHWQWNSSNDKQGP